MDPFSDPQAVAAYADGPPRLVPGFRDLQRMALVLLSESMPGDGRLLVVGAGGGLELKVFAEARPGWRFDGVDPSAAMLDLARRTLGPLAPRARLHRGTVDAAPDGPFDTAISLLTLHFVPEAERLRTLREIRRRLRPGGALVVAHHSVPEAGRAAWLARFADFAVASGVAPDRARAMREGVGAHLPFLTPERDEALIREAGFSDVALFYAAFTFRGWLARA
ncbi:methyltransferase domain-containing protein [Methylobacterium sp. NEAU 140]|uniref:class I SAM-dependent methyltransferase n=1 Tax=Methylobacterium sp. NEAU 140 TaxID=3064945 RepID=UPI0027355AF1|nr:class I SAM-dependent methyltransferase [Methylobacterium sp. NEAU 140]MDP4025103.1 methyltransferase domain-containing protein [Methylobacterium sp. NEAU 140]